MSSPTPEQPAAPQTLSEFEQQLCAQVLESQKAFAQQLAAKQQQFADAMAKQMQEQQARFQAQTAELMQALASGRMPMLPAAPAQSIVGESGQPQATAQPAAPAGPT